MADIETQKISELPEALTTSDSDAVLVVQGNKAKKARPSLFKGKKGDPGENAYLRFSGGWVQWRLGLAGSWVNIIHVSDLQGDSAYQVAVNNGFEGTEQEWLASLSAASESAAAIALAAAKAANDTNILVVQAEEARAEAETEREEAETEREEAESLRTEAETARATAETNRAGAETARASAESGRVTAEGKRQTDTASAIGDANAATTAANSAADRANAAAVISEELSAHPPVQQTGSDGNLTWWVWDLEDGEYVDTALPARGPQGKPLIVLDNGNYGNWNEATEEYGDSGVEAAATVDIEAQTVDFGEAEEKTAIASGDTLPVLFGKIKKWLSALRALAFKDKVNYSTDIENIPSTFTPSSHTHTKSQITDFPDITPQGIGAAAKAVQSSATLDEEAWTGDGPYTYVLSDSTVTANSFVTLWPGETSRQAARDADIFEDVITGAGTITIKATNEPAADISIKYTIEN